MAFWSGVQCLQQGAAAAPADPVIQVGALASNVSAERPWGFKHHVESTGGHGVFANLFDEAVLAAKRHQLAREWWLPACSG